MTRVCRFVLAAVCVGSAACNSLRTLPGANVRGCTGEPPIPPSGSVHISLAGAAESLLVRDNRGALVASARWSGEDLAARSHPEATAISLRRPRRPKEEVQGVPRSFPATIVAAPGEYDLFVHSLGGVPLTATLSIRRGFRDTLLVLIQARGNEVCY
jgi:hypothetical protein